MGQNRLFFRNLRQWKKTHTETQGHREFWTLKTIENRNGCSDGVPAVVCPAGADSEKPGGACPHVPQEGRCLSGKGKEAGLQGGGEKGQDDRAARGGRLKQNPNSTPKGLPDLK